MADHALTSRVSRGLLRRADDAGGGCQQRGDLRLGDARQAVCGDERGRLRGPEQRHTRWMPAKGDELLAEPQHLYLAQRAWQHALDRLPFCGGVEQ